MNSNRLAWGLETKKSISLDFRLFSLAALTIVLHLRRKPTNHNWLPTINTIYFNIYTIYFSISYYTIIVIGYWGHSPHFLLFFFSLVCSFQLNGQLNIKLDWKLFSWKLNDGGGILFWPFIRFYFYNEGWDLIWVKNIYNSLVILGTVLLNVLYFFIIQFSSFL